MNIILRAAKFAEIAHHGQKRKGMDLPYIIHPGRVAARISRLDNATEEMVAAAWCHDILEDTTVPANDIGNSLNFGTMQLVLELTNPSHKPENKALNRAARKQLDREHLSKVSLEAKCIKLADRADNLREMGHFADSFKRLYASESRLLYNALSEDNGITSSAVSSLATMPLFDELDAAIRWLEQTIDPEHY